jgi:hypothetical protein
MDNETRRGLDERKKLAGVSRHGQHEVANLMSTKEHYTSCVGMLLSKVLRDVMGGLALNRIRRELIAPSN